MAAEPAPQPERPKTVAELYKEQNLRWFDHPDQFVVEMFHVEPDPWQAEVLRLLPDPNRRYIAMAAAFGVGKTTIMAWVAWWALVVLYPVKVIATAPAMGQMGDGLLAECAKWYEKMHPAWQAQYQPTTTVIYRKVFPDLQYLTARTARPERSEALRGAHQDHVVILVDEAEGMHPALMEALNSSQTGPHVWMILASNTKRASGAFHDCFHKNRADWHPVRVTAHQSPRVSARSIERIKNRYGESSDAYRWMVLAEFPTRDQTGVIARDWVERAMVSWQPAPPWSWAPIIWGVDPNGGGGCLIGLAKRQELRLIEPVKEFQGKDAGDTVLHVVREFRSCPEHLRPAVILVDANGVGANVAPELRRIGLPAHGVMVQRGPPDDDYYQLRDWLWGQARKWFEDGGTLPAQDEIRDQLIAPSWTPVGREGRLKVQDYRSLGIGMDGVSALLLTFAPLDAARAKDDHETLGDLAPTAPQSPPARGGLWRLIWPSIGRARKRTRDRTTR